MGGVDRALEQSGNKDTENINMASTDSKAVALVIDPLSRAPGVMYGV